MLQIGRLRVVPHFSSGIVECHVRNPSARENHPTREKATRGGERETRRRRLRKRHPKSEFALLQTLSRLFHLVQVLQMLAFFLELNSKRLYRSSAKEKESRSLAFTSSTKRETGHENGHFHVLVVH